MPCDRLRWSGSQPIPDRIVAATVEDLCDEPGRYGGRDPGVLAAGLWFLPTPAPEPRSAGDLVPGHRHMARPGGCRVPADGDRWRRDGTHRRHRRAGAGEPVV